MVVFLVSGLWHGANWTFVVWGFLHGVYQIIGGMTLNARIRFTEMLRIKRSWRVYKLFQQIITFALVTFGWIFFRSEGITQAIVIVKSIFTDFSPMALVNNIAGVGLNLQNLLVLALSVLVLIFISLREKKGIVVFNKIENMHLLIRWPIYYALIFTVLILGIYGPGFAASQFIYFQF